MAEEAPVEIRPLVEEILRLLSFVEQRLQQSRTAIGNLSHALKTPLTALFRLLDDDRLRAAPELRSLIHEQAEAIHRRIERELKRARLAGNEPTRTGIRTGTSVRLRVRCAGSFRSVRGCAPGDPDCWVC